MRTSHSAHGERAPTKAVQILSDDENECRTQRIIAILVINKLPFRNEIKYSGTENKTKRKETETANNTN